MMLWYGSHVAFWQIALMWAGMIAFWVLVIWAVYALVTGATRRPDKRASDDAGSILDQRLARGEIDVEQYRTLREVLAG